MALLAIESLEKSFGGVTAVDGISFTVAEGETVGVIGPNGAGKTTVFNLITGFYRPDRGSIAFDGHDITGYAPHKLPHLGISRTFQNLRLFGPLTVFENVLSAVLSEKGYGVFASILRSNRYFVAESKAEEKARELLSFFQLAGREDSVANSLPYGEQRRLELARALATGPRLLLIDEPGAGMNPREIQDLIGIIKEMKEKFSLTVLVIEHQMELLMNVSERVVVMDFGRKIMEGRPEEVRKDKRVIEAYLGQELPC
jgi:branched-chain amino acid transport system ATP-binding protein